MKIKSTRVWIDEQFKEAILDIEDGVIKNIDESNTLDVDVDYGDKRILPGLVDIHNHGYNGYDANDLTKEQLQEWCNYLTTEGVTSFLATTSSSDTEKMLEAMHTISDYMKETHDGAKVLGIYSEGPLISLEFKGGQNPAYLKKPTREIIDQYQNACQGQLKYVCIAPECDENHEAIKACVEYGIQVALGHTAATYDECSKALADGAVAFTHTFNGMKGLHHREAGVVGAAMNHPEAYCELIGDGVHVSYPACSILAQIKGKDKLILVTDSVKTKGLKAGVYMKQGRSVTVDEEGYARLENGTLTGSGNKMNVLLKKMIEFVKADPVTVINAATCNPLKLLNMDFRKGYIRKGYDADLCVLNEDYSVAQTWIMGKETL